MLDTVSNATGFVLDTVLASYPFLRKKVTVIENKRYIYIYIYTVYFCFFPQVKSQIVYFFLFLLLTFPYYWIRGRNNVRSSDMTDHIIVMTGQNIASEMLSGHFTNDKYLWIFLQKNINQSSN